MPHSLSPDGKIARPDGGVEDWLVADCPPEALGFADVYARAGAILMARGAYEAVPAQGWPYAGKTVTVLTARAGRPAARGVRAVG